MTPRDEMKRLLESLAEKVLDNLEQYGFHIPAGLVVRAKEVETKEQADMMRGLRLYVPRSALPPPAEDEFYLADLIGLEARAPDGAVLGTVKAVEDFGAGDILEIAPAKGASWYLPFTREAAPELHMTEGWLLVVRPAEVQADGEEAE